MAAPSDPLRPRLLTKPQPANVGHQGGDFSLTEDGRPGPAPVQVSWSLHVNRSPCYRPEGEADPAGPRPTAYDTQALRGLAAQRALVFTK